MWGISLRLASPSPDLQLWRLNVIERRDLGPIDLSRASKLDMFSKEGKRDTQFRRSLR